jgi:hypothetical protein
MATIKGQNVIAPVVPFSTDDAYPSHEALYGKGGLRTVANTAERDAIPSLRREAGMLIYVVDAGEYQRLGNDLATWTAFAIQGPTGPRGEPGQQGVTGSAGAAIVGPTGSVGPQGERGATGPQGNAGAASTVTGPTGATGPAGSGGGSSSAGAYAATILFS